VPPACCAPSSPGSVPDGDGIPLDGDGIPLDGDGIPLDGDGIPLDGDGIPLGGVPLEGDGIPLPGEPLEGGGRLCWLLQAAMATAADASSEIRKILCILIALLLATRNEGVATATIASAYISFSRRRCGRSSVSPWRDHELP
jgi:hypothetical protein